MLKYYTPKELVTLELENGRKISFMSNDMEKAVEQGRMHLRKLGLSCGTLKSASNGNVLEPINVA